MWSDIKKFFVTWNEFITIPLGVLLWWLSPSILRSADPTAAVYDAGIFQIILFAVIQFLIYHGVAWFALKITFPKVYDYFNNEFEFDFKNKQWSKVSVALLLYIQYFYALVILSRVI